MYRPLPLFIGLRYTRAKRRNHFISFISLISTMGIAVGVTALITVLSVMNGFETELRARILGAISHATISGYDEGLEDWRHAIELASVNPLVVGAAPYVEREAMIQGLRVSGALLRGIDPELEPQVSELGDATLPNGLAVLKPGEFGIVLGSELAWWLGVELGDSVTVLAPQMQATPAGVMPTMRRFVVVGTFTVGMNQFDRGLALVHRSDAARLFRMGDAVTGVRLKLDDLFEARRLARELAEQMGGIYRVRDWTQEHANFFQAVAMERTVMFVILLLIVAVAAFNIISTLVMAVTDKQADIAILRTLGLPPLSVMGVFMVQGVVIGVFGALLGGVLGVTLALNVETLLPMIEQWTGRELFSADVYYISNLPSELRWPDVWLVCGLSLLASLLATLYPAWRASRTDPAAALRYE